MNVLIVGAGAVGKVYGRHLALGGAKVSFYVREKYEEEVRKGFHFYVLNNRTHRHTPLLWNNFRTFTAPEAVAQEKWDYVILSMSSTGLRSGWIDAFLPAVKDAAIVTLQPGMFDKEYLLARIPGSRLVDGTIHIVSYETPLPTEKVSTPGTAYWTPPGSFAAFSGPDALVTPLLATFKKGQMAVKRVTDARKLNIAAAPILNLFVHALENSNWSFQELKKNGLLEKLGAAIPEAVAITAKKENLPTPRIPFFMRNPLFFKGALNLGPCFIPFDIEAYLKVHFTKVGDQMHENMRNMIDYGKKNQLETKHLLALN